MHPWQPRRYQTLHHQLARFRHDKSGGAPLSWYRETRGGRASAAQQTGHIHRGLHNSRLLTAVTLPTPTMTDTIVRRQKWWHIQWFSDDDTPEERKWILKLDLLVVPFSILAYWVKYIDQANLNNAYVAGMKEDMGFYGNELVQLQTMYTVGAVVGMIPFLFLFTYIPMHWTIPAMDIFWGLFTLLQYRATSFAEMAAYRFLIGLFEAAFFPAMHFVFGSWYRGHEIARRGGLFYVGLNLGSLTAGLIASGTSARLEGVGGLAGWRWMYIICALITFPVGVLGYFVIPGTLDQPNRWVLNDTDLAVARKRLNRGGHVTKGKFKLVHIKRILASPHFWVVVLVDVLFWNAGIQKSTGAFLLWIKSLQRYSPSAINELGSIAPAVGILLNIVVCFSSDLLWGPAWAITFASVMNAVSLIILVVWKVPEPAAWFAFSGMYWSSALSSVLHGWVNTILRDSPEERSFTLVLITIIAQSSTAWTPLLTFPTVEAPRYPKGYSFCLGCAVALIVATHVLDVYIKRKESSKGQDSEGLTLSSSSTEVNNTAAAPDGPKGSVVKSAEVKA
ncbi:MFS transporter ACS family pantothenate transporter [Microdochium nivale]|nr:MFS transporter ACS family pantothenate transporter [Microdochium nivale]